MQEPGFRREDITEKIKLSVPNHSRNNETGEARDAKLPQSATELVATVQYNPLEVEKVTPKDPPNLYNDAVESLRKTGEENPSLIKIREKATEIFIENTAGHQHFWEFCDEMQVACPICLPFKKGKGRKVSLNVLNVERHLANIHGGIRLEKFGCADCGDTNVSPDSLARHWLCRVGNMRPSPF